jgi:hypothetical protein
MNYTDNEENHTSIFADNIHSKEVLLYNLDYESKKTRNTIWIISLILFLADFLAIAMAGLITPVTLISILITPAIFFGLGFLAYNQQVLAMIIVTVLFVALLIYSIFIVGATSIISGFLVKAVLIYLFIKGFKHAFEARKAKNDLKLLSL